MEDQKTKELLEQIRKENQEQSRLLKKQNRFIMILSITAILLCIVCMISLLVLVPKADQALTDMQKITEDLSRVNLAEMLEKIQSIDIETLNESINDLHNIVEPLSRLFSR